MIIFFGPAGAGKSVQGKILSARYGWKWTSSGELLRRTDDPSIKQALAEGRLIDTSTVQRLLITEFENYGDMDHMIMEGFPRTHDQAEWLIDTLKQHDQSVTLLVVLEVPRDEIIRRLMARGRSDDTEESIGRRLNMYRQEIYPILSYLTSQDIHVAHIDGTGTVGQVHDRINDELKACSLA